MFVLASKSPRRKELMKQITNDFLIEVSNAKEEIDPNDTPLEACRKIALEKGKVISINHYDDIVISADTIVVFDNQIIGKPKDENDAIRILHILSGNTHTVITCYHIFYKDIVLSNHSISEVTFNQLSDELISSYVATKSPLDKAGAYGVQDNEDFHIIKSVKGSLNNVIGFPVEEIKNDLIKNRLIYWTTPT